MTELGAGVGIETDSATAVGTRGGEGIGAVMGGSVDALSLTTANELSVPPFAPFAA
jgi:hypothetical protein